MFCAPHPVLHILSLYCTYIIQGDLVRLRWIINCQLYLNFCFSIAFQSAKISDSDAAKFRKRVYDKITMTKGIQYGLIAVGGLFILVAVFIAVCQRDQRRKSVGVTEVHSLAFGKVLLQYRSAETVFRHFTTLQETINRCLSVSAYFFLGSETRQLNLKKVIKLNRYFW